MPNHNTLDKDEITSLGASLRPIEQKLLKQDVQKDITRIWLQGIEPYFDVFFEFKNDEIVWFQFTLRGKSLSWDTKSKAWQTGLTNELKRDDISFYPASKTIDNDNLVDWEFTNLVKSILETRAEEQIFAKAIALFNAQDQEMGDEN
ncbi:hypothetical protein G7B40_027615 [Aetokthonos hydrillicola Thurmond2011]|jgi:hypothetical protein|uniref:Uncharacterized protein n=1 Tax=Aetokthonos hydrillicola Thurmond2011 TaxID=2712845 RepID=A0AAP5IB52_9CYAN|nr:hypothetical protein [Aetokthonos hydrillicola]MBO3459208.1 hypothetical protein [Aetokthonos hydrillicola CCALA 1050]MBW4584167.1 hypothetical protein [Aetokthonos hydrillicola CCALA 1050]MDR9898300.1 hypothetical protein [Aetokthonos hydrillicola Thurmond2011]